MQDSICGCHWKLVISSIDAPYGPRQGIGRDDGASLQHCPLRQLQSSRNDRGLVELFCNHDNQDGARLDAFAYNPGDANGVDSSSSGAESLGEAADDWLRQV